MHTEETIRTTSPTQTRWSEPRITLGLKRIQAQVGHECDSSTALYTHVSSDFMNTMLQKALAPALASTPPADKD